MYENKNVPSWKQLKVLHYNLTLSISLEDNSKHSNRKKFQLIECFVKKFKIFLKSKEKHG